MAKLSPAAQAILDAFFFNWADEPLGQDRQCLVAALRAVADQVMPEVWFESDDITEARDALLAIAAELEGINPTSEGD